MADTPNASGEPDELYLDAAATEPVTRNVIEAMMPFMTDAYANPASVHQPGKTAARALDAARACHDHDIMVMMGAPNLIRGGSHSGNVSAADLARAGHLDILSSDYVPAGLLPGAMILARLWDDLPRAMATVTQNPARAAGLADRGRIETGLRADLIRFQMMDETPVLRATWVRGQRV